MTQTTAAARRAAEARTVLNAYRRLFASEDGKIVMKDMMKSCSFFSPTIGKDAYETYFNEGLRAAVLRLLTTAKMKQEQIEQLAESLESNPTQYLD